MNSTPLYYTNQWTSQYQPDEVDRICQVQNEAVLQQQMALFRQQMFLHEPFYALEEFPSDSDSCQNMKILESIPDQNLKRAEHNAIERARRETLNNKYQQLALSLPNLRNDRRPSKGTILERTLEYVKETVEKEQAFKNEIDQLRKANTSLYSQMVSSDDDSDEDADTPQDHSCYSFKKQDYEWTQTPTDFLF